MHEQAFETNRCRQLSNVSSSSLPRPLSSKLTSIIGSKALFTLPHLPHSTSLWSSPACVVCITHTHEILVEPRELTWIWLSNAMKHSWASCWEAEAKSGRNWYTVCRKEVGPIGPGLGEYIWGIWIVKNVSLLNERDTSAYD